MGFPEFRATVFIGDWNGKQDLANVANPNQNDQTRFIKGKFAKSVHATQAKAGTNEDKDRNGHAGRLSFFIIY